MTNIFLPSTSHKISTDNKSTKIEPSRKDFQAEEMKFIVAYTLLLMVAVNCFKIKPAYRMTVSRTVRTQTIKQFAIIPGSPIVVGTIAQGLANGVSLFSNLLLVR